MLNKQKTILIEKMPIKDDGYNNELKYEYTEVFDKPDTLLSLKGLYVPVAKDRLYIFPDCNIPRFKLKSFCEDNKVSVAKFKDKANIWFTNSKNLSENYFEKYHYYDSVTKKAMIKYLMDAYLRCRDNELSTLIGEISALPTDFVLVRSNIVYNICNRGAYNGPKYHFLEKSDLIKYENGQVVPYDESLIECDRHNFYYFETPEQEANHNALVNHGDVYDETALVSLLNTDLVMDKEIYEGMKNLFESGDSDNHKIAMESMANCNFLKSAGYLLFLVKDYHYKMYNSDMRNHINFKSFCKFFNVDVRYNMSLDDIVDKLLDKDVMDQQCLDMILPLATEEVLQSGNTKYFHAVAVAPSIEVMTSVEKHLAAAQPVVPEPEQPEQEPAVETEIEIPEIPTPVVNLNNFYL